MNLCYAEKTREPAVLDLFQGRTLPHHKFSKEQLTKFEKQGIQSIDCGDETQATYAVNANCTYMHGTAGKMMVEDIQVTAPAAYLYITVGYHDKNRVPAVMMFNTEDCSGDPARFSFEPAVETVATYTSRDIKK